MDYKTYLDFVLAMDNKKEPQVIFPSIKQRIYITFFLNFFFRLLNIFLNFSTFRIEGI